MRVALRSIVAIFALVMFAATTAPAADLVLNGATAWKKDYVFNDGFWEFKRRVEKMSGGKIEVIDWSQADRDKFRTIAKKAWEETAAKSLEARAALDAHYAYMKKIGLIN